MAEDKTSAQKIEDYLRESKDLAKTKETLSIWIKGVKKEFDVYRIPTKLVRFRLENTRYEAEKIADEKESGPIKQETPEGRRRILKLLGYVGGVGVDAEAKRFLEEIEKDGQQYAGMITWDGRVLNGNRRLACIDILYKKKSSERFEYFLTVRLPQGLSEEDLFEIEAKVQWAKDWKRKYPPVNEYMMLSHALDYGWSNKKIANIINRKVEEIEEERAVFDLGKTYLNYRSDPKNFMLLDRQTELLTEAARQVLSFEASRTAAKEVLNYKKIVFKAVDFNVEKLGTIKYTDIRRLNKAWKGNDMKVLEVYEEILKAETPQEAKNIVLRGELLHHTHYIKEKPDKLANDLYDIAKKLEKESVMRQKLSPKSRSLITKTVLLLSRILRE